MHTAPQLDVSQFLINRYRRAATRDDLLPDWTPFDRLGVVVTEPFGGVGASHLIQLAITAFYDVRPERRAAKQDGVDPRAIYPEIYLFHVGEVHGDHSSYDFWPARKEVVVEDDPRLVLDAINDRAITRLAVPDADPVEVQHEYKEPSAARDRIATSFAYSPSGRVFEPEWEIAGVDRRTEINPGLALDPTKRFVAPSSRQKVPDDPFLRSRSWPVRTDARRAEAEHGIALAQQRRSAVRGEDGLATETYRSIDVDTALEMLVDRRATAGPVGR